MNECEYRITASGLFGFLLPGQSAPAGTQGGRVCAVMPPRDTEALKHLVAP